MKRKLFNKRFKERVELEERFNGLVSECNGHYICTCSCLSNNSHCFIVLDKRQRYCGRFATMTCAIEYCNGKEIEEYDI